MSAPSDNVHNLELRESIRDFVLGNAFNAMIVVREDVITEINECGVNLYGYSSRDELIGKSLPELLVPESRKTFAQRMDCIRRGSPPSGTRVYQVVRKDGSTIYTEMSIVSWFPDSCTVVALVRDVSAREMEMLAIQAKYDLLAASATDITWQIDLDGTFTFVSQAVERYGYSPEEIVGHNVIEFLPPHEAEDFRKNLDEAKRSPSHRLYEIQMLKKDGGIVWLELSVHLVSENGIPVSIQGIARGIDERKKAEEAIRRSEERYRTLIEQASDGIFLADPAGNYIEVNSSGCSMLGYTRDELLRMSIADIIRAEDMSELESQIRNLEARRTIVSEWQIKHKNGTLMPVEISAKQLAGGRLQGIVRDITRRKERQRALAESEKRYRGLIESQNGLIVRVDPEGRFTFVNDAYCQMFGKSQEELIGVSFVPYVHEDDIERTLSAMEKLRVPPYRCTVEQRAMTVNGWRWLAWEDCAILDEQGKTVEIQAIGHDITDRKNAEEALRRSEAKNREILNAMPDHVFRISGDGTYLDYMSSSGAELLVPPNEFLGRNLMEVLKGDLAEDRMRCVELALETGEPQILEYQVTTQGEPRYLEARHVVSAENEVLCIIRNVTDRKHAELRLLQAHADIERAYQLQRDFLNNVTHEIRTPLTAIRGYAEMLLEGLVGPMSEEQRSLLRKVLSCSDSLLEIVGGILEIARLKSGKVMLHPRVCSPSKLIDKAISTIIPLAMQKNLTLSTELPKEDKVGMYDEEKLMAVITNILSNAVKFTESGEISVVATCTDQGAEVIITDTGMGIREEDLSGIFDEFRQLDYPRKHKPTGFGLGLAIVATMVDTIGAGLTVSSVRGVGTAFTLKIPCLKVPDYEEAH